MRGCGSASPGSSDRVLAQQPGAMLLEAPSSAIRESWRQKRSPALPFDDQATGAATNRLPLLNSESNLAERTLRQYPPASPRQVQHARVLRATRRADDGRHQYARPARLASPQDPPRLRCPRAGQTGEQHGEHRRGSLRSHPELYQQRECQGRTGSAAVQLLASALRRFPGQAALGGRQLDGAAEFRPAGRIYGARTRPGRQTF